ncbi:MAG TPA: AraC family transcriptional regulator, partial [Nocardioides sp.]
MTSLGGDPAAYARAVGLPPDALHADDELVRDEAVAEVLETAARDLRRPDLGLRIAQRQDITMLGSLAVAIQHSPTLGDALDCTSRYLFVHGGSLSVRLGDDPRGQHGVAGLHYGPAGEGLVQGTDLGLAFTHRTITYLHGGPYGLLGVELPYGPAGDPAAYEEVFGAPVTFHAPGGAAVLRVPQALAAHRLTGVNDTLRRLALAHLATQTPLPGAG